MKEVLSKILSNGMRHSVVSKLYSPRVLRLNNNDTPRKRSQLPGLSGGLKRLSDRCCITEIQVYWIINHNQVKWNLYPILTLFMY